MNIANLQIRERKIYYIVIVIPSTLMDRDGTLKSRVRNFLLSLLRIIFLTIITKSVHPFNHIHIEQSTIRRWLTHSIQLESASICILILSQKNSLVWEVIHSIIFEDVTVSVAILAGIKGVNDNSS